MSGASNKKGRKKKSLQLHAAACVAVCCASAEEKGERKKKCHVVRAERSTRTRVGQFFLIFTKLMPHVRNTILSISSKFQLNL